MLDNIPPLPWRQDAQSDATAPTAPGIVLGDPFKRLFDPRSPIEEAIYHAHRAAAAYEAAGDPKTATAIRRLIGPKRPRGRPPTWTDETRYQLALAVGELRYRRPRLSQRRLFEILAGQDPWSAWTGEALKDQFRRFCAASRVKVEQGLKILADEPPEEK